MVVSILHKSSCLVLYVNYNFHIVLSYSVVETDGWNELTKKNTYEINGMPFVFCLSVFLFPYLHKNLRIFMFHHVFSNCLLKSCYFSCISNIIIYLDCIGTHFNCKKRMECPVCREVVNGRWTCSGDPNGGQNLDSTLDGAGHVYVVNFMVMFLFVCKFQLRYLDLTECLCCRLKRSLERKEFHYF